MIYNIVLDSKFSTSFRAGKVDSGEKTPLSPLVGKRESNHSLESRGFIAPAAFKARLTHRDMCQDSHSSRAGIGIISFEVSERLGRHLSPLYCFRLLNKDPFNHCLKTIYNNNVRVNCQERLKSFNKTLSYPTIYYSMFLINCQYENNVLDEKQK